MAFAILSPGRAYPVAAALAALSLAGPVRAAPNPFLQTLVSTPGSMVVAYGTDSASLAAARLIREAVRQLPGQSAWDGLRPAADFDADTFTVTGQTHVIAVGTLWDNAALRGRNWLPAWWMDRDWYYTQYKYALSPQKTGLPYQPTTGFFAAGYGAWAKGEKRIGYVECDRSPYFMEWMVRSRWEKVAGGPITAANAQKFWNLADDIKGDPAKGQITSFGVYPKDFPLRLLVRITGTGPAGLQAAAQAFAQQGLLCGAVLAPGAAPDPSPPLFALTADRYADHLPFTPPAGSGGYAYQGWLLPDAFDYDGFHHESGLTPLRMFRLKYKPDFGIVNFWTSPHRRAGEFEIAALRFSDAAQAQAAKDSLERGLHGLQAYKDGRVKGVATALNGAYLYVQAMPDPAGAAILAECAKLGGW